MKKITPFLWFDASLEEVVKFYTTVFPNVQVQSLNPMNATFVIDDQEFMALNGGPQFKFNEAVSFFIRCESQNEIDYFWQKLTADGRAEGRCGWLQDKYGVSWQVVPNVLGKYMSDADRTKANRVIQAMLKMKKLDIAALDAAYLA